MNTKDQIFTDWFYFYIMKGLYFPKCELTNEKTDYL